MFAYVALAIGTFPHKIHSGFFVGIAGILIVCCSVVCAIGLTTYLGYGLSLISSEVLPFLILAIGVDNMFIITTAFRRAEGEATDKRLGKALKEIGPSITSAAFCEMLAFIVGVLTKAPALIVFCLIATIAVLFDYIFQITTFVGILSLVTSLAFSIYLQPLTSCPEREKNQRQAHRPLLLYHRRQCRAAKS